MRRLFLLFTICFLWVISIISIGCKGKLDRELVGQIIKEKATYSDVTSRYGPGWNRVIFTQSPYYCNNLYRVMEELKKKGVVNKYTISQIVDNPYLSPETVLLSADFSKKYTRYFKEIERLKPITRPRNISYISYIDFGMWDFDSVEVQGVKFSGDKTKATALVRFKPNVLSQILCQHKCINDPRDCRISIFQGKAHFALYDDGWKLEGIQIKD